MLRTVAVVSGISVASCGSLEAWTGQYAPGPDRAGAGLVALIGVVLLAATTVLKRLFVADRRVSEHHSVTSYEEVRQAPETSAASQPVS